MKGWREREWQEERVPLFADGLFLVAVNEVDEGRFDVLEATSAQQGGNARRCACDDGLGDGVQTWLGWCCVLIPTPSSEA